VDDRPIQVFVLIHDDSTVFEHQLNQLKIIAGNSYMQWRIALDDRVDVNVGARFQNYFAHHIILSVQRDQQRREGLVIKYVHGSPSIDQRQRRLAVARFGGQVQCRFLFVRSVV